MRGRLARAEEFENIVVRANGPAGVLRIKDVASVELGAQTYDLPATVDGKPAIGMAVFLQTGANALDVARQIKAKLAEMRARLPAGRRLPGAVRHHPRGEGSIHEVQKTIFEAAVLVLLVVFVFLQTWRATLIPMLAVPVSLIGTFAGLYVFGFSINTLTLFAMVLAIGIVVDDAIVVLENVERLMREEKMDAHEAAIEAMREVSGALIAIVLVLCSVFVPVAFLGGIAGQLYKQFAVTVAIAVVISGFTALTLTPALCALLLRPGGHESPHVPPVQRRLREGDEHVPLGRGHGAAPPAAGGRGLPRRFARRRGALRRGAAQLHPARGPGLPHQLDPAARRRLAAAHAEDGRALPAGPREGSGDRARVRRRGARLHRRRQQAQCRHLVHPAEGLGRAHAQRAADRGRSHRASA